MWLILTSSTLKVRILIRVLLQLQHCRHAPLDPIGSLRQDSTWPIATNVAALLSLLLECARWRNIRPTPTRSVTNHGNHRKQCQHPMPPLQARYISRRLLSLTAMTTAMPVTERT